MSFILALVLLFVLLKIGGKSVKKFLTCLGTRWRDLPKYFIAALLMVGFGALSTVMDTTSLYVPLNQGNPYLPTFSWSGVVWYVVEFLLVCDFVGAWLVVLKHVTIDKGKDATDDFVVDSSKAKKDAPKANESEKEDNIERQKTFTTSNSPDNKSKEV